MIRSDLALAALATAAVPGMRPVSVAALRTGGDTALLHQSALVEDVTGRTWVVRSPLSPAAGAELERNDDLIRQLGKHLPFKVPAAAGYADLGQDGRAAVYPYVEGSALNLRHLPVGPGLASAVGRAIAAVHNMPRELFEEFAVPVFDAAEFRNRKLAELDRAAETGHVPNGLLARWEQALDAAPLWRFATVPTHGTLDGDSFLVVFSDETDAASGRVVGLTGWERAEVADPAEDFARLVELANPRAVDTAFDSYSLARSQRPDGYLLSRARLASEMRLLTGLATAVGSGDEQFVRQRADELRKLDRLTANDDSLIPRTALAPPVAAEPEVAEPDLTEPDLTEPLAPVEDATVPEDQATGFPAGEHPEASESDAGDEEPAFEVEAPADGAHLEPVAPHEPHVSAADVTAPIPMFRPVQSTPEPSPGEGATDEAATGVAATDEGATDAEAHLERATDEAGRDEDAPAPVDVEAPEPPDVRPTVSSTEEDQAPEPVGADEAEPLSDATESEATAAQGGSEPPADDDETRASSDDAGSQSPTEVETQSPTDDVGAPAPEDQAPTDAETQASADHETPTAPKADEVQEQGVQEQAAQARDREAEERLHTIYGMPEAADLESPEADR